MMRVMIQRTNNTRNTKKLILRNNSRVEIRYTVCERFLVGQRLCPSGGNSQKDGDTGYVDLYPDALDGIQFGTLRPGHVTSFEFLNYVYYVSMRIQQAATGDLVMHRTVQLPIELCVDHLNANDEPDDDGCC